MIRRYLALTLLIVFALAITPKQLLHDAVANHKHHCTLPTPDARISKASFLCDCDNLVAEGSFIQIANLTLVHPQVEYAVYSLHHHKYYQPLAIAAFRLRGPPAA